MIWDAGGFCGYSDVEWGSLFAEVLEKLRAQRFAGEVELVVVDSGSRDETVALAERAGAKVVKILPAEFDHGLTRNRGIELASGEIVVLMTQDAVPADEFLIERLVGGFEDPRVGGVLRGRFRGPSMMCWWRGIYLAWIAGSAERRVSEVTDRAVYDAMSPMERYFFCVFDNVCSAVRRSAWREIPFHQSAFGEDVEWSKRALEAGWKIVYEPAAAVVHSHDRPAWYEYKRTYMAHRTLFRLFGLSTIPAFSYVPRCLVFSMLGDWKYVWRHERGLRRKMWLMARVPMLSWGSVMGQYRGARDEREGRGKKLGGV